MHLESAAAEESSASAVVKNLLRKPTHLKFVYMLHFLLDYLVNTQELLPFVSKEQLFLSTTELHVKNTMASIESLKLCPGQYEEKFITKTSLKGVHQDVQLHGLSSTTRSSSGCENENLI